MSFDALTEEQASLITKETVTKIDPFPSSDQFFSWKAVTDKDNTFVIVTGPKIPLQILGDWLSQIVNQTNQMEPPRIPEYVADYSESVVPFDYISFQVDTNAKTLADTRSKLSDAQVSRIYLQLGAYLKELHEKVQNDWFGIPQRPISAKPVNPLGLLADLPESAFSWQETFLELLEASLAPLKEALLSQHAAEEVEAVYTKIHTLLSRAIGSFLFDDAEVPSLTCSVVSLVDERTVYLDDQQEPLVSFILPIIGLSQAMWGDPALGNAFISDGAGLDELRRVAFDEGYASNLFLFKRQKTKRAWYDLYVFSKRAGTGEVSKALEGLKEHVSKIEQGVLY